LSTLLARLGASGSPLPDSGTAKIADLLLD
jgi:hypothetical protein